MAENKKDDVALNMTVDRTLKDEFSKAAKDNISDSSKEIRKFMQKYVNEHKSKSD